MVHNPRAESSDKIPHLFLGSHIVRDGIHLCTVGNHIFLKVLEQCNMINLVVLKVLFFLFSVFVTYKSEQLPSKTRAMALMSATQSPTIVRNNIMHNRPAIE